MDPLAPAPQQADRIRARFNVSAAQLDEHDLWQSATLAAAVVSNDGKIANSVLNQVRDLVEAEARCLISRVLANGTTIRASGSLV